jgi:haloalkane dehalogenase
MMTETISDEIPYPSSFVEVYGSKMHFIESGRGDAILFLHGIPTSCYVWRNIIPYLAPLGRCIAPDLIGFGQSDKPNIEYSIFNHIKYIDKFIETLQLKNITLVMHGWGSLIGFDYAMRNENNCKGLVFYESFLRTSNGNDLSLPYQEQLSELHREEYIDSLTMPGTAFVDKIIPQNAMRKLSDEEMQHYREPFMQKGASKPILQYLKELPKGNNESDVDKLIENYSRKLCQSDLPKLMLYSVPGFITTIATVIWAKEHLTHLEIVDIGEELHFAQESYPALMGETISVWLQGVDQLL